MSETKVPALPDVPGSLAPQQKSFFAALKELIEVREGRRGDSLDTAVTFRDLLGDPAASVRVRPGRRPAVTSLGGTPFVSTPPPAVSGFSAVGAYSSIILSWDKPLYPNPAYVEVWRSNTDLLLEAVLIGTTEAEVYSDACGEDRSYYYWVRNVSTSNIKGPWQGLNGLFASTSPDVPYLLTVLENQLSEDQLTNSLLDRINLIDDSGTINLSVTQRLDNLIAGARNEFVNVDTFNAYKTADEAFAEQIRGMAFVDPTDGTVSALEGVIITQDNDRNNTAIRFNAVEARVGTAESSIVNESTVRATQDAALANQIGLLTTEYNGNKTAVQSQITALSNADAALVTSTNTLAARVNNLNGSGVSIESAYSAQALVNGNLNAQYTVKINNSTNKWVTGFGLAQTTVNGETVGSFTILADKFSIAPSATNPNAADGAPFFHIATAQTINGVLVQPGTYMKAAFISDASITNAKIRNAAIDSAKIADLAVTNAKIASLSADKITAGTISAEISIQAPNISGANISGGTITGGEIVGGRVEGAIVEGGELFVPSVAAWKFKVEEDGTLHAQQANISGHIEATSGSFSGSLDVKSATTGQRLEIKDNVIKVYDENNTLRVQIGDLSV